MKFFPSLARPASLRYSTRACWTAWAGLTKHYERGGVPHKLLAWVIGLSLFGTLATEASHFRFGSLSWKPTGVSGEVQFDLTAAFRRDGYSGSGPDGHPITGDIITETLGDTTFDFGDGTPLTTALDFRVTAYSVTDNYIITVALDPGTASEGILHAYSSAGPYTAGVATCCRISALNNRSQADYYIRTEVSPFAGNSSPVSTLVPIITVPVSSAANFSVPASDPDGDPLTWRVSSEGEAGGGPSPPNLSINPTNGLVTWNTIGLDTNNFWTVQIEIEDHDGTGPAKTRTPVDFLLRINPTATSNTPPAIAITPPGPVTNLAGTPISFTVTGTDADAGDTVTLNTGGLPNGATMLPSLPVTGASGTNSTFNWTPNASQGGTYLIIYSATDSYGSQTNASIPITVLAPPLITGQPQARR